MHMASLQQGYKGSIGYDTWVWWPFPANPAIQPLTAYSRPSRYRSFYLLTDGSVQLLLKNSRQANDGPWAQRAQC